PTKIASPRSRPARTRARYSEIGPSSAIIANAGVEYSTSRPYVRARPAPKLHSTYAASHRETMDTTTEPRDPGWPRSRARATVATPSRRRTPRVTSAQRVMRAHRHRRRVRMSHTIAGVQLLHRTVSTATY